MLDSLPSLCALARQCDPLEKARTGGGVKGGCVHGATDEMGMHAVEKVCTIHDLHATVLHLLGLNHEKLTYRFAGRDFRLTDVHGHVVKEILR